jgi:hypothetical protein
VRRARGFDRDESERTRHPTNRGAAETRRKRGEHQRKEFESAELAEIAEQSVSCLRVRLAASGGGVYRLAHLPRGHVAELVAIPAAGLKQQMEQPLQPALEQQRG